MPTTSNGPQHKFWCLALKGEGLGECTCQPRDAQCRECGKMGRYPGNGVFQCRNPACINFPYMTEQNKDKYPKFPWQHR